MIKINLAPYEESQDRLWFLPDVSTLAASYLIAQLICGYSLRATEEGLADIRQKTEAEKNVAAQLAPRVREVKGIKTQIETLSSRRESMAKITDSKLNRFLPIILFEHLQNLKPEGLWFTSATMADKAPINLELTPTAAPAALGPDGKPLVPAVGVQAAGNVNRPGNSAPVYILIKGNAFNPSLIAEFMTSLKATRNQDVDPTDLRTQVFFPKVGLVELTVSNAKVYQNSDQRLVQFDFYVAHEERKPTDIPRGMEIPAADVSRVPDANSSPSKVKPAAAPPPGNPNVSLAPAIEVPL